MDLGLPIEPPEPWQFDLLRDYKEGRKRLNYPIIDFEGQVVGRLEAVTRSDAEDDELIERFVRWRNQNRMGWLDQRPVSFDATRRWVQSVIDQPDRIALHIFQGDQLVGRCGLIKMTRSWSESDGLVRGEKGGGLYFIHHSQVAGIKWHLEALRHEAIVSKVLSTNDGGLNSCRSLGYNMDPIDARPVYLHSYPDGDVVLETGSEAQRIEGVFLYYLLITKASFEKQYSEWYSR